MIKCKKCGTEKNETDFYVREGKVIKPCKECSKKATRDYLHEKRKNSEWVEKERVRGRVNYIKLNVREKYSIYRNDFPEKIVAANLTQLLRKPGLEIHHWSYNAEHLTDIIFLTRESHREIHRYIIYDREQFMYRRIDNNLLLNSKELHINYINNILKPLT